jgi:hypothetical protein
MRQRSRENRAAEKPCLRQENLPSSQRSSVMNNKRSIVEAPTVKKITSPNDLMA